MVKIIHSRPPNYSDILRVFPKAAGKKVIFAYNNAIYIPSGRELPPELRAHEFVHLGRQGETEEEAQEWWYKYLNDQSFRYHEEVLAHRAEYETLLFPESTRQRRRGALKATAKKLSAPLYGSMTTRQQALKDLEGHRTC